MPKFYIAERRSEGIVLELLEAMLPSQHDGVTTVAVTGSAHPEALALEAATSHFERRPERTKLLIIALSGFTMWR
jgi:hypothetical protein